MNRLQVVFLVVHIVTDIPICVLLTASYLYLQFGLPIYHDNADATVRLSSIMFVAGLISVGFECRNVARKARSAEPTEPRWSVGPVTGVSAVLALVLWPIYGWSIIVSASVRAVCTILIWRYGIRRMISVVRWR